LSVQTDQSSILHKDPQNDALQTPVLRQESAIFRSILFNDCDSGAELGSKDPPEFFTDLNLDQIVESITAGRDEYNLKPYFYAPLKSVEAIHYRQDVFRDLEVPSLFDQVQSFAGAMRQMRSFITRSEKFYYKYQKDALLLSAAEVYCAAVSRLTCDLLSAAPQSLGIRGLRDYLARYAGSGDYQILAAETERLRKDLQSVRYSLRIDGKRVTVGQYSDAPDLSAEVLWTFEKFRQGASKEYQFRISNWPEMNHIEAAILDRVARLYPELFSRLEEFPIRHCGFLDSVTAAFDREMQFYISCIEFKRRVEQDGLPFCYPVVAMSKDIHAHDTFDLALANKLVEGHRSVVTNTFFLKDRERIFVVSGPNQGGKTTFARTVGQLHYLACLGCAVPGTNAKLLLFDQIFSHFERQEYLQNLSGKLEDELKRIHRILAQASDKSILIMNESFLSTTLSDAVFLSKQIMQRILSLDMLCVTVTFVDELATLSNSTVSIVSTVDPQDPALRTFKIVRKPADGLAYAAAIAQKHYLTQDAIVERITAKGRRENPS
jgi:DNA mismatch repair protein MutS